MKSFCTYFFICFSVLMFAQSVEQSKTLCTTTFYSLEYALEKADEITRLDLSNQNLTELPASIGDLKNLEVLKLSDNPLTKLPKELENLKKLKVLQLQNINIEAVNETFAVLSKLENLERLDLDGNFLLFLPTSINQLKKLKYLDLSHTNLEELGSGLWDLDSLITLNLSNNNLPVIDGKINQIQNLENVDLSYNPNLEISDSFEAIASIPNLKTFTIKGLNRLPITIRYFSQVEKLDFSNSSIKVLPSQVKQLQSLKTLTLDDCSPLSLKDVFNLFEEIDSLETLSIINHNIAILPKGIADLTNLKRLSIGGKNFQNLSTDFKKLENLKELSITEAPQTDWKKVFSTIGNLEQLEQVNLSANQATSLPNDLGKLKYVKALDLSFNDLENLPSTIQHLKQLETLQLFGNKFSIEAIQQIQLWLPNCKIAHDVSQELMVQKEIAPPLENVEIVAEQFTVSAEQPKTINLESGSKIIIPENAFLDANGKIISGEVDITYREFNNPTDIFLSGIPMTIESNGKTETFQSAGMMEFRAYQKGTEVFPNPDNLIEVEVVTNQANDNFGVYDWNEENNEWVTDDSQQDKILNIDSSSLSRLARDPRSLTTPIRPPVYEATVNINTNINFSRYFHEKQRKWKQKKNKIKKFYITFRHMKDRLSNAEKRNAERKKYKAFKYFPETKPLKKYDWVYDGEKNRLEINKELTITYFASRRKTYISDEGLERWGINFAEFKQKKAQDVFIEPNLKEDNYNLCIVRVSDTLVIPVYPNVRINNPIYEQKRNEKIFEAYTSTYEKRTKDWADFDAKYGEALKKYEKDLEEYRKTSTERRNAARNEISANTRLEMEVRRSIGLNQFGIKNIDVILKKRGEQLLANFKDEDNKSIKPALIYILDKSNNTVLVNYNNSLFYDKAATMKIVALFDENTIGIVEPAAFSQARKNKKGTSATFSPKIIKLNDYKSEELKALLRS